jgi:hypothetical protein
MSYERFARRAPLRNLRIKFPMWDGCSRLLVPKQGAGARRSEGAERTNERLRLFGVLDEICDQERMSTTSFCGAASF